MPKAKKYMRTAPVVDLPTPSSPEDVYTEIRALVQRRLDRLHLEEQQLADVLTQIGSVSPVMPEEDGDMPTRRRAKAPRKNHKMSAAARKAVSDRMKKYWAAKRKEERAEKAAEK